ncbi:GTP-binding protein [Wenzhouxiangella marina]|uniref:GTP-binding protein n=1 Tax=Wenzhouxiangella marina TaxID=1579979 RepID=A0A0K0XYA1_9GAMM|nr:ATP/GTP-binding protein [Wenzhouxiangella marina]AKS42607.1 GTP-binding protein [Wenzhouxiangella marina]MBB6085611.1 hypothetical protein [Wenzhouxiangella marina]
MRGQLDRILFAGPVGAGKTSAIAAVSDSPVSRTEAGASDEVRERKAQTTVAMDYGTLDIDDRTTIQLIGAPGQERFSFMWDILAERAIGLVLLLDHARPDPLGDLEFYLKAFRSLMDRAGSGTVVGITRCDLSEAVDLEPYRLALQEEGLSLPVFEVDARERDDVKVALLALVAELHPMVHRHHSR